MNKAPVGQALAKVPCKICPPIPPVRICQKNFAGQLRSAPVSGTKIATLDSNLTFAFSLDRLALVIEQQNFDALEGIAYGDGLCGSLYLMIEEALQDHAGFAAAHCNVQQTVGVEVLSEDF